MSLENDLFWFADKTVIVTGGNGAIGQGIVAAFSERDANVVIAGIGEPRVPQKTRGKGRLLEVRTDITNSEAVAALVDRTLQEFGRIDVLVNNAGAGEGMARLFELDQSMMDWMTRLNIYGTTYMTKAVAAEMAKVKRGSIVMISSCAAYSGRAGQFDPFYSGAKGFMTSFTKALAIDLGPLGIRLNTVAPGWIVPESSDTTSTASFWQKGKFGTPESFNAEFVKGGVESLHAASD